MGMGEAVIGLALEAATRYVAEAISIAVIVAALLSIPYMIAALIWERRRPVVRNTYRNPDAFYHPSLWFLTWLTRINIGGIGFVMTVLFIRIALRYEVVGDVTPQPFWSLALSATASLVIVIVWILPATFLFTVKRWICEDDDLDRRGRIRRNVESDWESGRTG